MEKSLQPGNVLIESLREIIQQDEKAEVSAKDTLQKLKIALGLAYPLPADDDPN